MAYWFYILKDEFFIPTSSTLKLTILSRVHMSVYSHLVESEFEAQCFKCLAPGKGHACIYPLPSVSAEQEDAQRTMPSDCRGGLAAGLEQLSHQVLSEN